MNNKIRDTLLFFICFALVFNNIPTGVQMNFLGGPVGNKLAFYPLFLGFIFTAYYQWKYKNILIDLRKFSQYIFLYVFFILISLLIGVFNYPYWNEVFAGPITQIEKVYRIVIFCRNYGIDVNVEFMTVFWIIASSIKGVLFETIWCFGSSYMFYCWYRDNWRRGLNIACLGVFVSTLIFIVYGIVDACFLAGNVTAKKILITLNPYLHPIESENGWWPPLLWNGQIRSVFPEPSHIGNFLAVILPISFFKYLKSGNKWILLMSCILSFLVVLSKARTAYAMLLGIIFLILIICLEDFKTNRKKIATMLSVIIVGFFSGVYYLNVVNVHKNETYSNKQYTIGTVLDDNLFSLLSADKRSNGARYALIKTNLRIARKYPLLGVGKGLGKAYMIENYTEYEKSNIEVAMWIRNTKEYGIFAGGQGIGCAMNEFVTRLSNTGILGLLIYILPFVIAIYNLFIISIKENNIESKLLIVILIGTLVSGCNGSVNIIYSIWIFLGISFALIYGRGVPINDGN